MNVEHESVEPLGAGELQRVVAAVAHGHSEARLGEALADERGDLFFVFDDEETHPGSVDSVPDDDKRPRKRSKNDNVVMSDPGKVIAEARKSGSAEIEMETAGHKGPL